MSVAASVLQPHPQVHQDVQLLNDDCSRQLELGGHPVDPLARFIYHDRLHSAPVIVPSSAGVPHRPLPRASRQATVWTFLTMACDCVPVKTQNAFKELLR